MIYNNNIIVNVKTPLRNRLKDGHLNVCCRVAIDGPQPDILDYKKLV